MLTKITMAICPSIALSVILKTASKRNTFALVIWTKAWLEKQWELEAVLKTLEFKVKWERFWLCAKHTQLCNVLSSQVRPVLNALNTLATFQKSQLSKLLLRSSSQTKKLKHALSRLSYMFQKSGLLVNQYPFFPSRSLTQAESLWTSHWKAMVMQRPTNKKQRKSKRTNSLQLTKMSVLTTELSTWECLLTKLLWDSSQPCVNSLESIFTHKASSKFIHLNS